jgi:glycerol kinase
LPAVPDNLYVFPSFGSIFSPFWKTGVPGAIKGLNFNTTNQHLLHGLLEAITFRLYDNIKHHKFDTVKKIIVDGGMAANSKFMQTQADMFEGKIIEVRELDTCWGVAKGVLVARN